MADYKKLLDQINSFEGTHTPDAILQGLETQGKDAFPDLVNKIREYRTQNIDPVNIISGLKDGLTKKTAPESMMTKVGRGILTPARLVAEMGTLMGQSAAAGYVGVGELAKGLITGKGFDPSLSKAAQTVKQIQEMPPMIEATPTEKKILEAAGKPFEMAGTGLAGLAELATTGSPEKATDVIQGRSPGSTIATPVARVGGEAAAMFTLPLVARKIIRTGVEGGKAFKEGFKEGRRARSEAEAEYYRNQKRLGTEETKPGDVIDVEPLDISEPLKGMDPVPEKPSAGPPLAPSVPEAPLGPGKPPRGGPAPIPVPQTPTEIQAQIASLQARSDDLRGRGMVVPTSIGTQIRGLTDQLKAIQEGQAPSPIEALVKPGITLPPSPLAPTLPPVAPAPGLPVEGAGIQQPVSPLPEPGPVQEQPKPPEKIPGVGEIPPESKVRDESGQPLKMFHASKTPITEWKEGQTTKFFSRPLTKEFGESVVEAYLDIRNPAPNLTEWQTNRDKYDGAFWAAVDYEGNPGFMAQVKDPKQIIRVPEAPAVKEEAKPPEKPVAAKPTTQITWYRASDSLSPEIPRSTTPFFSSNEGIAGTYGRRVRPYHLKAEAKIADESVIPNELNRKADKRKWAQENKYDGVIYAGEAGHDELVILNKDVLVSGESPKAKPTVAEGEPTTPPAKAQPEAKPSGLPAPRKVEAKELWEYRGGDKVSGNYFGHPFSGIVESTSENQAKRGQFELTVKLDEPINVYGEKRDTIIVDKNSLAEVKVKTPDKVGDSQSIMGISVAVAETKTIDGIEYSLFNANALKDKRGFTRVFDPESHRVVGITAFDTFDKAETYFKDLTAKATKGTEEPKPTKPGLPAPRKQLPPAPEGKENLHPADDKMFKKAQSVLDEVKKLFNFDKPLTVVPKRRPYPGGTAAIYNIETGEISLVFRNRSEGVWDKTPVPEDALIEHFGHEIAHALEKGHGERFKVGRDEIVKQVSRIWKGEEVAAKPTGLPAPKVEAKPPAEKPTVKPEAPAKEEVAKPAVPKEEGKGEKKPVIEEKAKEEKKLDLTPGEITLRKTIEEQKAFREGEKVEVKVEPEKPIKVETPKDQKKYLLSAIDEAIKNAPEEGVANEYVVIEIPKDGTFTIKNNKASLNEFKKKADKLTITPAPAGGLPAPKKPPQATGKRLSGEVEYYNPFRPRKEKVQVIEARYVYGNGFFSNGFYAVKTDKPVPHPKQDKMTVGKEADEMMKNVIPGIKNYSPAEIVGEFNIGRSERSEPRVDIVDQKGNHIVADTKYIDSVLTLHPTAKVFVETKDPSKSPILFQADGKTVGVVMPIRDQATVKWLDDNLARIREAEPIAKVPSGIPTPRKEGKKGAKEGVTGLSELAAKQRAEGQRGSVGGPKGGGEEEFKFDDPKVQERYDKSVITEPSISDKLTSFLGELWHKATRSYEHLPRGAEFAPLEFVLKNLEKQKGISSHKANEMIGEALSALSKKEYQTFAVKMVLEDLSYEANRGHELPWGLTPEMLPKELAKVDRIVSQNPKIQKAIDARKKYRDEFLPKYIKAMKDIGLDVSERFQNPAYFRHQVLEYVNAKGLYGTGAKLKTPAGRSFLKGRSGAEMDINRDFIQPEYEVLAQMHYDIAVAKVIKFVDDNYNVVTRFKDMAKGKNFEVLVGGPKVVARIRELEGQLAELRAVAEDEGGMDSGDKKMAKIIGDELRELDPTRPFKQKRAIGFSKLEKMGIDTDDFAAVAELAKEDSEAGAAAKTVLKGITEREQFIKETLGDKYLEWKHGIDKRVLKGSGYAKWQPREGDIFFMADSIPAKMAEKLYSKAMEEIGITEEDLTEVMASGGRRREFIVKEEVALTLKALATPDSNFFLWRGVRAIMAKWKAWTLVSPRRFPKYNLRNVTGDSEAAFIGNPSTFKDAPQSTQELYKVFYKKEPITGELREFFERGGFHSNLQAMEMGELPDIWVYQRLYEQHRTSLEKVVNAPKHLWQKYWSTVRIATDFREGILRYAAYLNYLRQMQRNPNGRPDNFGGSKPEEIVALKDIRDRAYWLSNDLIGAYDRISVMGQSLRKYAYPFWSFPEANFRRFIQFARNSADNREVAILVGSKVLKGVAHTPFIAYRVGRFVMYAMAFSTAFTLWNNLMFPEEEKEVPENERGRPHIVVGRDKDGKVLYFTRIGALGDFLSFFGLDDTPNKISSYLRGEKTIKEIAKDMAHSPVNKLAQGIGPQYKVPLELALKRSTFPEFFKPGLIRDNWLYLARQFGLENEYIALAGLPSRGYKASLKNFLLYSADPGQSAYREIQDAKRRWSEEQGKGAEGFWLTPKGEALYNLKLAVRYEDKAAFEKYLWEYFMIPGSTEEGLKKSINRMDPLAGLSKDDKELFKTSLSKNQKEQLVKAYMFYMDTLVGKGEISSPVPEGPAEKIKWGSMGPMGIKPNPQRQPTNRP